MNIRSKAIGCLDKSLSGPNQEDHEIHMRDAARGGLIDLARTLACGDVDDPAKRLRTMVERLRADTVMVPALAHLEHLGVDAAAVNTVCAVIECEQVPPRVWERGSIHNADNVAARELAWHS